MILCKLVDPIGSKKDYIISWIFMILVARLSVSLYSLQAVRMLHGFVFCFFVGCNSVSFIHFTIHFVIALKYYIYIGMRYFSILQRYLKELWSVTKKIPSLLLLLTTLFCKLQKVWIMLALWSDCSGAGVTDFTLCTLSYLSPHNISIFVCALFIIFLPFRSLLISLVSCPNR